ncbi:MAG: LTA synthase family protein [bacterium]|nr:LTA synthase family protein [bacterium]
MLKKIKKIIIEYIISNRLFLSYVVISLISTLVTRSYTIGLEKSIYPFITDLGIILIIGSIGYFIKPKNQYKYFFTCVCIFSLIGLINSIYYVFYSSFASIGELASLSQTETVTGSIWEKFRIHYLIFIFFPLIFNIIHKKLSASSYYNFINCIEKSKTMVMSTLIVGITLLATSFIFAQKSDYSRLKKQWNRLYIVDRFGVLLYQGNDIVQTLTPKINSLFGYEDALKLFNDYYSSEDNQKYKEENKYTNILDGYNIIFVHMESIQDFAMDLEYDGEQITPNLNKLAKEGLFFSNFYPQVSTGTSSDTEFTLLSSLMPAASGTVFVSYYNRNYNTLPKILKEDGYFTFSMHGNLASMWNRNKAHPNLGYDGMYFEESFTYNEDDVINLGINDKLFFQESIPILENIEIEYTNYMGTIITLSNHSPFTFIDKYGEFDFSEEVEVLNEETGEIETITTNYLKNTAIGNYLTSVHYADSALGDFLTYINASDAFDNTVFVFYGDHDAKLTRKEINYLYNHNSINGELYTEEDENYIDYNSFEHELNKKTPLIMWTKNAKLKNVLQGEVKYYMGMIDVAPTILNMFGKTNEYALGHDIFNIKNNNIIAFPNGNFLTNVMYYNNSTGEYYILNDSTVIEDGYVDIRKDYIENLLEVSNSIIVYDLLNKKETNND